MFFFNEMRRSLFYFLYPPIPPFYKFVLNFSIIFLFYRPPTPRVPLPPRYKIRPEHKGKVSSSSWYKFDALQQEFISTGRVQT